MNVLSVGQSETDGKGPMAPATKPGAQVKQGQVIGYSGSASGVDHLHFGCLDWRAYQGVAEG